MNQEDQQAATLSFYHQTVIERPRGLPGYRPKVWCSVCGKSATEGVDIRCDIANCPNLCHILCLKGKQKFNCEETTELRTTSGIQEAVAFLIADDNTSRIKESSQIDTDLDEQEKLNLLQKEELITIVQNQRSELATIKVQLTHYKSIIDDLPRKRSILVEAISIIDTLVATQASIETVQQRSIASSAIPEKIDEAYKSQIQDSQESSKSSGTPRVQENKVVKERNSHFRLQQQSKQHSRPQQQQRRYQQREYYQKQQNQNWRGDTYTNNYNKSNNHSSYNNRHQDRRERCSTCHRSGHSTENCLSQQYCDYCNKRYHTRESCRLRIADQRQQDFLQTLNQKTTETVNTAIARSLQIHQLHSGYQPPTINQHSRTQYFNPSPNQIYGQQTAYTYNQNGNHQIAPHPPAMQ